MQKLGEIYQNATTIGGKTKAKELRTENGLKDKYQEYFINKVNSFMTNAHGSNLERQNRINAFLNSLPQVVTSPVWRLQGQLVFLPVSGLMITDASAFRT